MASRKQLEPTLAKYGFTYVEEPGFQSFHRIHHDGSDQYVRFFTWSNKAHAEKQGIPRAYLVVVVQEGRFRLPLVQWPSIEQKRVPFAAALEELESVFLETLELDKESRSMFFAGLDDRYVL
ncbi:hypothetical protein ACTXM3_08605 [Glutamicibacter arilaitensis]|uniref:hypothetical protein n=1 Tax=Glutamicibacter arilaitensis TaxID=256701 RepID=UPI003FCFCBF3